MTFPGLLKLSSVLGRIVFCFSLVFCISNKGSAQDIPCMFDDYLQQQLQEHPEMKKEMEWFNEYAKNYKLQDFNKMRGNSEKMIIPVVVHVFHNNGDENISDAQIKSQIEMLNKDFQRLNPDTIKLMPDFKPLKEGDKITCEVTKTACGHTTTAVSNTITVSFQPSVTISTADTSVCTGSNTEVTFTAYPVNGGTSPVYQWKKNSVNVGENTVTFTDSSWANGDIVTCIMTSNSPCHPDGVVSNSIKMTVSDSLNAFLKLSQSPGEICAGTAIDLSAIPAVAGYSPKYNWFMNGDTIAGATNAFYSINKPDTALYYCRMISNAGCVTNDTVYSDTLKGSKTATITPSVTISQTTASICSDPQYVTFTATAINGAAYQWKINGVKAGSSNPPSATLNLRTWSIAADFGIEFRLASIDPNGNCTNGIVRRYSPLTESADDNIKEISVWPSDKYLNMWVVKNIKTNRNEWGGLILGYATFPMPGTSFFSRDGVIIRSDHFGTIGTSDTIKKWGRVATHEIGHWMSLMHPFQDSCQGGDLVQDTPPVAGPNFLCPLGRNSCGNDNPDFPDMVQNFMDYSDGNCENIFTEGQKVRAMAAMTAYRNILFSHNNLIATGSDDASPANICAPVAAFNAIVNTACEGGQVSFYDYSYNAAVTSWNWSFPGGNPSSSTEQFPKVTYATAGNYDVTLTVSNSVGNSTVTMPSYIKIAPTNAGINGLAQDFESLNFPYNWTLSSTSKNNWSRTNKAEFQGNASMMFANNLNETDGKISITSPNINLRDAPSKFISFYYAYAPRAIAGVASLDRLTVYVSTDCGKTWVSAWSRNGTLLNSLTGIPTSVFNYYPVYPNEWKLVEVPLITWSTRTNILVRLEFSSKGGHNIFIDNINLGYPTGIEQPSATTISAAMDIFPNPAMNAATISYELDGTSHVDLNMYDITGRKVLQLVNETITSGTHEIYLDADRLKHLGAGTYIIEMKTPTQIITRKFINL